VLILCLRLLHGTVATDVWQEILTPSTLAFSFEEMHEKWWKSVHCKKYSKKISGTCLCRHGV